MVKKLDLLKFPFDFVMPFDKVLIPLLGRAFVMLDAESGLLLLALADKLGLFNLGGRAIRRGRVVRLNSLLNASVSMFEMVFSKMFSISEPNMGDL